MSIEPEGLEFQKVMRTMLLKVAQIAALSQVLLAEPVLASRFTRRGHLPAIAKWVVIVDRRGRCLVRTTSA